MWIESSSGMQSPRFRKSWVIKYWSRSPSRIKLDSIACEGNNAVRFAETLSAYSSGKT